MTTPQHLEPCCPQHGTSCTGNRALAFYFCGISIAWCRGRMHAIPTSPHGSDLYILSPLTRTIFKKIRYLWLKPGANFSALAYFPSLPTPLSTSHPSGNKRDPHSIRWDMQTIDERKESVATKAHILFFPPLKGPGYNEIHSV